MVTCRDILNLKLDGVSLVAGENGLDRAVTWTYLCQSKPYSDHMNRGNFALIVIDYVRFDMKGAYEAMNELAELGISGLAISVEDDKEKIPDYFRNRANVLKLPLFYIRWDGATFVDIDQSVAQLINESSEENRRSGEYLYNLLFGFDINDRYVEKISGQFGLDFSNPHRVGIIVVNRKYGVNLEQDEHLYEHYAESLRTMLTGLEEIPMFLQFLNKFVVLFEATPDKKTEHGIEKTLRKIDAKEEFVGKIDSTCILGGVYLHPEDYGRSYQEAKSLIPKIDVLPNPKQKKVLSASAMGIYKYLFNSGNHAEIMNYCDSKLEKIEEYDHANGTYLEETLLSYYMNGFNLTKTAKALYIHRNSLQYRLDKIQELLDMDLDDYLEYLDIVNCILVKRFMFL